MLIVGRIPVEPNVRVIWDHRVERAVRIGSSGVLDVFAHDGKLVSSLTHDVSRWRPDGFASNGATLVARDDDALELVELSSGSMAKIEAPARRPHFHSAVVLDDPDLLAFITSDNQTHLNVARISTREILFTSSAIGVSLDLHWLKQVGPDHIAINSISDGARAEVWNWNRRERVRRDGTIEGVEKALELWCVEDGALLQVRERGEVRATWRWRALFPDEAQVPCSESRFTDVRPTWAGANLIALLVGSECLFLDVHAGELVARVTLSEREGNIRFSPEIPLTPPISREAGVIMALSSSRLVCRMANRVEVCFSTAELVHRLAAGHSQ